jgi:hypothetical protein
MRRFPPLLIVLAACGPGRPDTGVPRYAIVTTIPESDPMHREIESLAALRWADIFHATSFAADAEDLRDWLLDRAPDFVAAVVRPAEITPAEVGALTDVLRRLDDDPFPDAALGWFIAADAAFLHRQIQTLRGAEAKVEKRLQQATVLRAGPRADRTDRLAWANGLPLRRIDAPPTDSPYLQERVSAFQRCDYLLLGAPPLRGLRLDCAVVFSELPGSGNPYKPWLADLLQAGAAAVFAPLGEERASDAEREWADAIVTDEELGEVWRRSEETAILSGQPSGARLLYGCPLLDVYTRPARAAVKQVAVHRANGEIQATFQVVSWDNPAIFSDRAGRERFHLRFSAPDEVRRVQVLEARAEAQGRSVEVSAPAVALERRGPVQTVHVLLRAPRLALEDLFLTVRLKVD